MNEYLLRIYQDGTITAVIESNSSEDYSKKLEILRPILKGKNVMYANKVIEDKQ